MMNPFVRAAIGVAVALTLSAHGMRKKSLSMSGSVAAFAVGFLHTAVSLRFGTILILFYYTSSYLTKLKQERKRVLEAHYKVGGQRNWIQVLSNSAMATVTATLFWLLVGEDANVDLQKYRLPVDFDDREQVALVLTCMLVAHYACCTADTWASEVGILSAGRPRLAVALFTRTVPHGTNGGMSLLGTGASFAGGAFIGICYFALSGFERSQLPMIGFGAVCGVLGSLIDSVLGGIFQATYYSEERKCIVERPDEVDTSIVHVCGWDILSNDAVNILSIAFTMLAGSLLGPIVFNLF